MASEMNSTVKAAAQDAIKRGWVNAKADWKFQSTREVVWAFILYQIGPEFGFNPNPKDGEKPEDKAERIATIQAAEAAWRKYAADGYSLESSNLGKVLDANKVITLPKKDAPVDATGKTYG